MIVVYNTCGISGKDNTDYYIRGIYSLLNQDFTDKKIVLSACLNKDEHIDKLRKEFGNSINYSIINDKHTVNTTFNKTIQESIKHLGSHPGYLYMDSGCIMNHTDTIAYMNSFFETDKFGMITMKTDTDTGLDGSIGYIPQDNIILPMGKACNLHCQIFHNDIQQLFGRIIPDIFRSFCTESTFPFLNACILRDWTVLSHKVVSHWHGMDGASSGFGDNCGWTDVFPPYNIHKIISDPEGTECGFGYEECGHIKMHNRNAYDENYKCKDPARLAKFIKENIFMSKDVLDYDKIKCEWF